jgi:hypothetical protein
LPIAKRPACVVRLICIDSWPRLFDSIYPSRLIAICILFNGKRDFVPNLYSFFIFLSTVTIVSFLFPPCATYKILVISKPNPLPVP